jgi:predicted TPR repeat methyltransferase
MMRFILQQNPKRIVDVGCGFGKFGLLCREYLECLKNGVFLSKDWKVHLTAVEVFPAYVQDHHRAIYDDIIFADVSNPNFLFPKADLVIFGDVLEHIPTWESVISKVPSSCDIVIAVPDGPDPQDPAFGNEHERHVVTFVPEMLQKVGCHVLRVGATLIATKLGV